MRSFLTRAALLGLASWLAVACDSSSSDLAQYRFDRPVDITYGCITGLTDDAGVLQAITVPLGECDQLTPGEQDAGVAQGTLFGLAVQNTRDEVLVVNLRNTDVRDSDPLTPGLSGVTVGGRPVAADTTADGCTAVIANAATCDLSLVDIAGAAVGRGGVSRRLAVSGSGGVLAAAPAAVATPPAALERTTCAGANGLAYVALPTCGAVAAIDVATGEVVSHLTIPAGAGAGTVGGAELSCPIECAGTAAVGGDASGRAQPRTLAMAKDGSHLVVGATGSSDLHLVELGTDGLLVADTVVPLEGATGVSDVAITGDIAMGQGGVSGVHRFVYAIGDDLAVHVADVTPGQPPMECDTQVDPRYLIDFTDVSLLPCFGVGLPTTPPRRPGARGPGVRLPGGAVPFGVDFMSGDVVLDDLPGPFEMNGTFAVVTGRAASLTGTAFYINVDDDIYEDFPDPSEPGAIDPVLALPHTLRDGIADRLTLLPEGCGDAAAFSSAAVGPVRIQGNPAIPNGLYNSTLSLAEGDYLAGAEVPARLYPLIHLERCETDRSAPDDDISDDRAVWQLAAQSPAAVRLKVFADLFAVPIERWTVAWEGRLERSAFDSIRQGGVVRVVPGELAMELRDESRPFCEIGVLPGDRVQLIGCSTNADCGLTERCVVHPESPSSTGMCLPTDQIEELTAQCRAFMTSSRRYVVRRAADSVHQDQLVLAPLPTLLASSPPDGCTGAEQCVALYNDEVDQIEAATGQPQSRDKQWTCDQNGDLGGPPRCIATCPNNTDAECPSGSVCQDLRCVEGGFAGQECVATLQLYEARAGDAFTVIGSQTGYLHNQIADLDTGACFTDPAGSPLRLGRFPVAPPPCDAEDGVIPTGPNPCSVELDEPVTVIRADGARFLGHRKARGVRFRNFGMRIDFTDVITVHAVLPGIFQAAYPRGFVFTFDIGGGFTARGDSLGAAFPQRVRSAPDGTVWITDSGDSFDSLGQLRRGQLLNVDEAGVSLVVD